MGGSKHPVYGEIPNGWGVKKLRDVSVPKNGIQTGPFGSQLHKSDYKLAGTPIITVEHIGDNRIIHEGTPFVSDEDKRRLDRYSMKQGDIIFSRVGSVDRSALVRKEEEGWLFSGRCLRVRPDTKLIDPGFLSYFMSQRVFKEHIRRIAVGATMPSINTQILEEVEVLLPPLAEQRRIAHILGTLDDKIELNRRMNATLEAIARALFKSWFVDFDPVRAKAAGRPSGLPPALDALFPSRFVDSELGEIPEGWEVAQLSELGQIVCGKTPPKVRPEYFDGPIPFIKIPDMHNSTFVVNTIDSLTQEGANSQLDKYLPPESILVSCIATVGLVSLTSQKSQTNQQINAIIPKYANSVFFLYFLAKNLEQKLKDLGSGGSATLNVNTSIFSSIRSLYPGNGVVSAFDQAIRPIFNLILSSLRENNTLANTRDSLLSELMY